MVIINGKQSKNKLYARAIRLTVLREAGGGRLSQEPERDLHFEEELFYNNSRSVAGYPQRTKNINCPAGPERHAGGKR